VLASVSSLSFNSLSLPLSSSSLTNSSKKDTASVQASICSLPPTSARLSCGSLLAHNRPTPTPASSPQHAPQAPVLARQQQRQQQRVQRQPYEREWPQQWGFQWRRISKCPPHLSRRSTQDNSPRMNNNASSSSSRSGRGYNEPLSSNNANHSRPPSPPQSISRSSTSHDGQDSGTPPPARDPPA